MIKHLLLASLSLLLLASSCSISLINRNIDYTVIKTFNINQFGTKDPNAPPTSGLSFSEQLKTRVLNDTRLTYIQEAADADIRFSGNVTSYRVEGIAATANQTAALQRLTIQLTVTFVNITDKTGKSNWTDNFSRFAEFSAEEDLGTLEQQLIEEVYDQILDDVFNKSFSGW